MGGEGAMMQMIQALKNNKSLLSKRKERRGLEGSYSNVKLEFEKTATEEDLKRLRLKLQKEHRQSRKKTLLVFGSILLIFIVLFIYFY